MRALWRRQSAGARSRGGSELCERSRGQRPLKRAAVVPPSPPLQGVYCGGGLICNAPLLSSRQHPRPESRFAVPVAEKTAGPPRTVRDLHAIQLNCQVMSLLVRGNVGSPAARCRPIARNCPAARRRLPARNRQAPQNLPDHPGTYFSSSWAPSILVGSRASSSFSLVIRPFSRTMS